MYVAFVWMRLLKRFELLAYLGFERCEIREQ
jgi:hypothetical protein